MQLFQGGSDPGGLNVAVEVVRDLRQRQSLLRILEGVQDLVGHLVPGASLEDEVGALLTVIPQREPGEQVPDLDLPATLQGRVDLGEPPDLGLRPGGHSPEEANLSLREVGVQDLPEFGGGPTAVLVLRLLGEVDVLLVSPERYSPPQSLY